MRPAFHASNSAAILVDLNLVERRVPVPPRTVGPFVEHCGVEVAEGQFAQVGLGARALAEVGRHGARMDGAELQMRRHPAGGGQVRPVAVLGVVLESLLRERLPLTPGRALACGQLQFDSEVGDVHPAGNVLRIDPLCGFRAGRRRRPPAVLAPRGVERGEHLVRCAVVLGHPSRRHQVGRSRLLERHPVPDPAERVAYRVVATAAERRVVRGHVHRRCADRLRQRGNSFLRTATGHLQSPVEAVAHVAQRVVEVLQPAPSRRCLQPWIQDVAGEHLAVGGRGVEQGGQVVQPQIAPEPQQCGHAIDAARNSR